MIQRIWIKNFRSLVDIDVKLGPLTVLVGRNAVGKSSFLDALRIIRDALNGNLEDALSERHGIAALRRWAPTKPYDIEIGVELIERGIKYDYSFVLASGREGAFSVKREFAEIRKVDGMLLDGYETKNAQWVRRPESLSEKMYRKPETSSLALSVISVFSPRFNKLKGYFRKSGFYTIYPNTLRTPQKPSLQKTLTDHGENLAPILKNLKKEDRKQKILRALGKIAEGVCDYRVKAIGGYLITELQHQIGENDKAWFDLSQESDGTLRFLGILAALYQTKTHSLIAIEEPELTLHPGALAVLSDVLKDSARRNQVIITTQSPDLIARFEPELLKVVERRGGSSAIGPVSATQLEALNKQLFSTSDLIRIEGLKTDELPLG